MIDHKTDRVIRTVADLGMDKAEQVFTKLLKTSVKIEIEKVYMADISDVTASANGLDTKIIGASVDLKGEIPFKFLFYVEERDSMLITDLMLRRPPGTAKEYDKYVYSAVQEAGNILASAMAGVFAADFKMRLAPQPPTVIHSFTGAVFEEYVMSTAASADEMLIIESMFKLTGHDLKCMMYMVPLCGAEKLIEFITSGIY
jgi:chemotaxis protein CheC